MASLNKAILIGNLGKDPEVRYMPNGNAVTSVTIATNERWKDKNTGDKQERTEWHRVTFYSPLAEVVGQYLKKGSQVYVEGRIQTRKWQDKNTGQDRYTTEIIANEMKMLGGRGDSGSDTSFAPEEGESQYRPAARPQPAAAPARPQSAPPQPSGPPDFDEDIPF